jgi:glycosyltransferase involved in cell wall biosynthesis
MRICLYNLTSGFKNGGLETFTWGLAEALVATGHEVEIVAGTGDRVSPSSHIRLTQFEFTPREAFPDLGTRFRKLAERLSFARKALAYVRDGRFDVVLINKPYDFFVLKQLKRSGYAGITCYNSGGTEFFMGDRWLSRAVDLWLPCSEYNAGKISAHYGCDYTILNNGVDTERFTPQGTREDLRLAYSIPEAATIVISVGRLIGSKGGHIIVEAIRKLPGLHFVVVGVGPDRARLEALAQSLDIADRVHFTGEVRHVDLPPFLRGADVFVQPSIGEEAFGISVAEAMACGLPVLASNAWGLREVVVDRESGLLVAPSEIDAWEEALQFIANNPEVAAQMGQAGRARAVSRFTWLEAARTLERSVRQISDQRSG